MLLLLEAETGFGLDFLRNVPLNESTIFSPLSIALALSLIHAGAKGESKSEIRNVLLENADEDKFESHFKLISESLKKTQNGVESRVGNRVYVKDGFPIEKTYLEKVEKLYSASAESIDFKKSDSPQKINEFISEQTNGNIDKLVTSESIKDAVGLLVNALYFKGDWLDDFSRFSTSNLDFEIDGRNRKTVPFMKEYFEMRDYAQNEQFQVLALPYKDTSYRFVMFLPKVRHTLLKTLRFFTAKQFQNLLTSTKQSLLNVVIPKFKIEKELQLKPILESLGISKIFSDTADLSGIAKNIKISDGAHKSFIEVNEEGTVAAATTVMKAVPMMAHSGEPVEFRADHPFLFALVKDNHPVFMGVFQG